MHVLVIEIVGAGRGVISGEEWRHAGRSLRLGAGDILLGTSGDGNLYTCRILTISRDQATLEVLEMLEKQDAISGRVILAAGNLHDTDRMEWMLEKAVELGITDFCPLITEHTVKKGSNVERLERISRSACKQSKRYYFPNIHPVQPLRVFITQYLPAAIWFAWCGAPTPVLDATMPDPGQDHIILIGPEGDFSPDERDLINALHPQEISLGTMRLRSETAAIMALAVRSARAGQ